MKNWLQLIKSDRILSTLNGKIVGFNLNNKKVIQLNDHHNGCRINKLELYDIKVNAHAHTAYHLKIFHLEIKILIRIKKDHLNAKLMKN